MSYGERRGWACGGEGKESKSRASPAFPSATRGRSRLWATVQSQFLDLFHVTSLGTTPSRIPKHTTISGISPRLFHVKPLTQRDFTATIPSTLPHCHLRQWNEGQTLEEAASSRAFKQHRDRPGRWPPRSRAKPNLTFCSSIFDCLFQHVPSTAGAAPSMLLT